MRRIIRAFAGLLAIASVVASWPVSAGDEPRACQVLAMTYNIRLDTPADGENSWSHRRDLLIGQIQILRPALLGMQEVLPNQRADIEAMLDGYDIVGGGRDDGKLAGEASPIAIERDLFRIASSGTFWLSPTPDLPSRGWDAAYPRIVTWARVQHRPSGAKLLVINTHWDHEGQQSRIESGKLLAQWILSHRKVGEGVVVLGDFNTDANDPAIVTMLEAARLTNALGALDLGPNEKRPSSFNAFGAMPPPGKAIDHIFVGDGIAPLQTMVIAQHFDGRVASDHFPVAALLAMPERASNRACQ